MGRITQGQLSALIGDSVSKKILDELYSLISDPFKLSLTMIIPTKKHGNRPFELHWEQRSILDALVADESILAFKERQIGVSTVIMYYLFWKWLTSADEIRIGVASKDEDTTKEVMDMFRSFYLSLPDVLRPPLDKDNETEIRRKDTRSKIVARTSGKKGGVFRGFTLQILYGTEFAHWENASRALGGAIGALNEGQLILDSTPAYIGDPLYSRFVSKDDHGRKIRRFQFRWFEHKPYDLPTTEEDEIILNNEEERLIAQYKVGWGYLKFRRTKIAEYQAAGAAEADELFGFEYPNSFDEAYKSRAGTWFKPSQIERLVGIPCPREPQTIIDLPDQKDRYSMGIDPSHAVGANPFSARITSKRTGRVVWRLDHDDGLDYCVSACAEAAKRFNCIVIVEINGIGREVYDRLVSMGCNMWSHTNGSLWKTGDGNRETLFGVLRDEIDQGRLTAVDEACRLQLGKIRRGPSGQIILSGRVGDGEHSDSAFALALSVYALRDVCLPVEAAVHPWLLKEEARVMASLGFRSLSR